jgi:hypothetical protein
VWGLEGGSVADTMDQILFLIDVDQVLPVEGDAIQEEIQVRILDTALLILAYFHANYE